MTGNRIGDIMKAIWILAAVAALPLSMTVPAAAHHSMAMFNREETVTVQGLIKEFQWTNPHGYLIVTSDEDSRDWVVELGSIKQMAAAGIRNTSFGPGEEITVTFHPVKTAIPVGQFLSATREDGTVLRRHSGRP